MSEFKSGDKVITTAKGGWYREGEVFTLKEPYECKYYAVDGWTIQWTITSGATITAFFLYMR